MAYYNSMQELIGNTPIVKLNNMDVPKNINVYAKLEYYNPSGSVKDRTGKYMIEAAEKEGILKKNSVIIDSTAGNMGMGIAFAALNKGYKIIFTVPVKFSQEKQTLLRALGAEIINTSLDGGMLEANNKAKELCEKIPNSVTLDQFSNMQNPLAHYEQTGMEIYRDLDGKIDCVVAGAGSGGTFSGVLKYLKEKNPNVKGILADPVGSTMGGGEHANYNIEGIGNDFIADTMDMKLVDEVVKITDKEAFETTRLLAKREGIFAGTSSGAAMAAVLKFAQKIEKGDIVTIFPDRGDRYFSKGIYE